MKQIYILTTVLFLNCISLIAQTDIITGLDFPNGLEINGNDLYIAEYDGNKISKINITATTPTATDVVTGLSGPAGIVLNGNDLYIAEYDGNKISKIDITATTPTATDVVTGLSSPTGIVFNGNDLYIAEHDGNKISKIDITATTPTATDVVTVEGPWHLILDNNILYITEADVDTVSKLNLSTLSLSDLNLDNVKVRISPNPADEFVQVLGLGVKESYKIYNVFGTEIKNGIINNQQEIDIRNFSNGLYFLKFENGATIKFLKK